MLPAGYFLRNYAIFIGNKLVTNGNKVCYHRITARFNLLPPPLTPPMFTDNGGDIMKKIDAKKILSNFRNANTMADVENKEIRAGMQPKFSGEKVLADVSKVGESENKKITSADVEKITATDLPIYSATSEQINYWHACGGNVFVQNILRPYDLGYGSTAFDAFKIGLDEESHAITFAVDEENHYIKIQLTENNVTPTDVKQAEKVFNKVNSMRKERYQDLITRRTITLRTLL